MSSRLNLHIDESGSQDLSSGHYIVTVVLHNHSFDIASPIKKYEERLILAELPDISFHGKELIHGNSAYRTVSPGDRKRLLTQFARLVRELPISYLTLRYSVTDTHNRKELESRIRRDLASIIFDNLAYFQSFDTISVYYDNGQGAVNVALHDALDFVLAKNVADYRNANHNARRLLQVADYICTVEHSIIAFNNGKPTKGQLRFFGTRRNFMQSYVKQLASKRFCSK